MRGNDGTRTAFFDPEYSVLGLSPGLSRNGVRYLDIVTGWQVSARVSRGNVVRCRPAGTEGPLSRTGVQ
jgi:hypothetical protein